jgi:hypothetical protein
MKKVLLNLSLVAILAKTTMIFATTNPNANQTTSELISQSMSPNVPTLYIENKGQWSDDVLLHVKQPQLNAWITRNGFVLDAYQLLSGKNDDANKRKSNSKNQTSKLGQVVRFNHVNSNSNLLIRAVKKNETEFNYFTNGQITKAQSGEEYLIENVYNGINQRWYFDNGKIRFDYIVQPGGALHQLKWNVEGANQVSVKNNDLVISTQLGDIELKGLTIKQNNQTLAARWKVNRNNQVGLEIENYNPAYELIIDPFISFNAAINTQTGDFWNAEAIVTEMKVDGSNRVHICGYTEAADFPNSAGIYSNNTSSYDGFYTVFNASLTNILGSTYISGNAFDEVTDIVLDNNFIILVGNTYSSDLLSTPVYAYENFWQNGYILKLDVSLSSILSSTYYSSNAGDVTIRKAQKAGSTLLIYSDTWANGGFPFSVSGSLTGFNNLVLAKVNTTSLNVTSASYFGGTNYDQVKDVVRNNTSNLSYILVETGSSDFTGSNNTFGTFAGGSSDALVAIWNETSNQITDVRYIGGTSYDTPYGIARNASNGNIAITGITNSNDYPLSASPLSSTPPSPSQEFGFASVFNSSLNSLVYSSYLGVSNPSDIKYENFGGDEYLYTTGITQNVTPFNFTLNAPTAWQYRGNIIRLKLSDNSTYIARVVPGNTSSFFNNILHVKGLNHVVIAGQTTEWLLFNLTTDSITYTLNPDAGAYYNIPVVSETCLGYITFSGGFYSYCEGVGFQLPIQPSNLFTNAVWFGPNGFSYTNDTLIINPFNSAVHAGTYTAIATDINGCESKVYFNVIGALNVPHPYVSDSIYSCLNSNISIPINNNFGKAVWNLPNGSTATTFNPNSLNLFLTPSLVGNYTTTIYFGPFNACFKYDTATVYSTQFPNPASVSDKVLCEGSNLTVNPIYIPAQSYTHTWNGPLTNNVTAPQLQINDVHAGHAGTYTLVISDGNGCTATKTFNVSVKPMPLTTIVPNGSQLIAVQSGASYQWINCTLNQNISGATNQTYIPVDTALHHQYAVIINLNGCIDTTDCFVNMTSVEEQFATFGWAVYPNPSQGEFFIQTPNDGIFDIIDMNGKLVHSFIAYAGQSYQVTNLPAGVYVIFNREKKSHQRIVISE